MTLTDFLLARIADDEAEAQDIYRWLGTDDFDSREGRVLAGCEAKRRIIDACRVDCDDDLASGDDTTSLATEVLLHLALIYVDHPDYDEQAWRP